MIFGLIVAALITGCGTASQPPAATTRPHADPAPEPSPAGRAVTAASADELVLRWRLVGGIAGRGGPGTLPDFSLYGDGRAIVPATGTRTGPATLAAQVGSTQGRKARPWPIGALGDGAAARGERCTILSGRDMSSASRLLRVAQPGSRWSSGGKVYAVRLRPLLPDESGCIDIQGS